MPARYTLELVPVTPELRSVVENLLQFYEYDWSEISGLIDVNEQGLFELMGVDWTDPTLQAFLFRVNTHWAGFALVKRHSLLTDDGANTWFMDEFFVMRRYRRAGIGAEAATRLFDRFPGWWEVAQTYNNTGAQTFWRTVIGRSTGGAYEQTTLTEARRWQGPVQRFRSPTR